MNQITRRIFCTDDWLSRHPRITAALCVIALVLASSVENW